MIKRLSTAHYISLYIIYCTKKNRRKLTYIKKYVRNNHEQSFSSLEWSTHLYKKAEPDRSAYKL